MQQQTPVIYFLGASPSRYQPLIPTFIVGWHPERLRVQLAFGALVGASAQATLPASPERRYALREIKARLHQASFRDAVLSAYGGRCAISHPPEPRLLDAAHIVMDADEQLGQPIVSNGLPVSTKGFSVTIFSRPTRGSTCLSRPQIAIMTIGNVTIG
jgi:putative restriction endonuclease